MNDERRYRGLFDQPTLSGVQAELGQGKSGVTGYLAELEE